MDSPDLYGAGLSSSEDIVAAAQRHAENALRAAESAAFAVSKTAKRDADEAGLPPRPAGKSLRALRAAKVPEPDTDDDDSALMKLDSYADVEALFGFSGATACLIPQPQLSAAVLVYIPSHSSSSDIAPYSALCVHATPTAEGSTTAPFKPHSLIDLDGPKIDIDDEAFLATMADWEKASCEFNFDLTPSEAGMMLL